MVVVVISLSWSLWSSCRSHCSRHVMVIVLWLLCGGGGCMVAGVVVTLSLLSHSGGGGGVVVWVVVASLSLSLCHCRPPSLLMQGAAAVPPAPSDTEEGPPMSSGLQVSVISEAVGEHEWVIQSMT
jgi:hypothetical protein